MKKKLFVLCLAILLVLPATLFAGSFLGLKVGAAAILNEPIPLDPESTFDPTQISIDDLSFGADIRLNVSVLEVSSLIQGMVMDWGEYGMGAYLYSYVGAGLSLELFGLVDFGITAGPFIDAIVTESGDFWTSLDEATIEEQSLYLRGTVDVNLGGISVGLFAMVDPQVTIGDLMDPAFDPGSIAEPTSAIGGISVLLGLL